MSTEHARERVFVRESSSLREILVTFSDEQTLLRSEYASVDTRAMFDARKQRQVATLMCKRLRVYYRERDAKHERLLCKLEHEYNDVHKQRVRNARRCAKRALALREKYAR